MFPLSVPEMYLANLADKTFWFSLGLRHFFLSGWDVVSVGAVVFPSFCGGSGLWKRTLGWKYSQL